MIATVFWILFLWHGSSQSMMKTDTLTDCLYVRLKLYDVARNNSTFGIPLSEFHCVKMDTEASPFDE